MTDNYWSQTFTGRAFFYDEPERNEYVLEDIAQGLSNICRYGGMTIGHYSVAQHSCALATFVWKNHQDPVFALDALFHDAAEAYIGDIRTPLKDACPEIRVLENRIQAALLDYVRTELRIPVSLVPRPRMKEYDRRIVNDEKALRMNECELPWYGMEGMPPLDLPSGLFNEMTPKLAKCLWLESVSHYAQLARFKGAIS